MNSDDEQAPCIEYRQALPADAAAMFAMHKESVHSLCRSAYSPAEIDAWFWDRTPAIYEQALAEGGIHLACAQGEVAGFVGFTRGEVTLLFVSPRHAGLGLGRALFELGLARASAGHQGVMVVVATRNSQRFYERYGFVEVERQAIIRGAPEVQIEVIRMERPGSAGLPRRAPSDMPAGAKKP